MVISAAIFNVRGDLQNFVSYLGTERAALVKTIVLNGGFADGSSDRGSWIVEGRTKGKLVALKHAYLVNMRAVRNVKTCKLGSILDWVTGGRLDTESLEITMN